MLLYRDSIVLVPVYEYTRQVCIKIKLPNLSQYEELFKFKMSNTVRVYSYTRITP